MTFCVPSVALAQVPPPPTGPVAPQPQPQPQPETQPQPQPTGELSEDQKIELAKEKYMQAEGLAGQGRWVEAVPFYEEAYYLVPGKHGFAHKVGVAAWNAGDCDKANSYLKHFLQYGDPEKQGDKFDEAKQILGEISVSGCATPTTTTTTTTTTSEPTDNDNPLDDSTTVVRQQEAKKARDAKKSEKRGLLIGGAVLTSFGIAGVAVGITGLAIASGSANQLGDLSTNQTNSGFPIGDYDCRNDLGCPSQLESRMATGNALGYVGLIGGGVMLGAGVAMLAVYMINKKKSGGATEATAANRMSNKVELTALGPALLPNGAGAVAGLRF
ncbi:hypothetical protein DB30_01291 [Enhygromyxa salina]|uniref:Tetratricopeptide repeat protein n=1 Tax=Enhygromyxa salina TaxID=215803 RepID=A0A0C1Z4D3_9BACT|nr:hypothetical protein DB30_01291 [Enhygromyxa salina]